MPQISQISEIFASQLFWLLVSFGLVYVVIGRLMLPKVEATVELRDRRIAEDLAAAESARAKADETEELYRARMDANRAEAMKITQSAKADASREAEARIRSAEAELDAKIAAAEERIAASAAAAASEIENVAAEAAQQMVARLSGKDVSREQAATAVSQVISHG